MSDKMSRDSYEKMVQENKEWLEKQPHSLEKDHIKQILDHAVRYEYDKTEKEIELEAKLKESEKDRKFKLVIFAMLKKEYDKLEVENRDLKKELDQYKGKRYSIDEVEKIAFDHLERLKEKSE